MYTLFIVCVYLYSQRGGFIVCVYLYSQRGGFIVCVYLYSQRGGFIVELFTMAIKLSFERSSVFGEITPKRKKQVGNV